MVIMTVIKFVRDKHWLDKQMDDECKLWFSMVFKLMIFDDVDFFNKTLALIAEDPEFGKFCIQKVHVCSCN